MIHMHKGVRFIISNAAYTRFFAFGGGQRVRWSQTVDNLVEAEKFETVEEAQATIAEGKTGRWGEIDREEFYFVVPVDVFVSIDVPAPVLRRNKGSVNENAG